MKTSLRKVIWIILCCLLILAFLSAWFQSQPDKDVQQAVTDARQALRQQGFKTDLADFNFSTDAASRTRESALTDFNVRLQFDPSGESLNLMPVAGDAVVVVWQQDSLKTESGVIQWTDLHDALDGNRWVLDAACDAALSGPIRFELDASKGGGMLLRHLAPLRNLALALGSREMLELHDGNQEAAWTNLLAATRLVTAWEPEPAEVSHLVHFGLATAAFNDTWQALQNDGWPDKKLASLQHEWESVNFFTNLPETAAFRRASTVAMCQLEREEPLTGGISLPDLIKTAVHSPAEAYSDLKLGFNQVRYRSYGTFDDEKNLLLYFQNRELELRRAIQPPTWAEMRALPGVSNAVPFKSPYPSQMLAAMNLHGTGMNIQRMGISLLGRAAEAEARRRILVTAIALERYREKHGAYPPTLAALVPEFLKTSPVDFMDGQPLRYRLMDDGPFILYSVGLDCTDDGGKMPAPGARTMRVGGGGFFGAPPDADIVWPRPATTNEVDVKIGT